jgi:hypothetical protein
MYTMHAGVASDMPTWVAEKVGQQCRPAPPTSQPHSTCTSHVSLRTAAGRTPQSPKKCKLNPHLLITALGVRASVTVVCSGLVDGMCLYLRFARVLSSRSSTYA